MTNPNPGLPPSQTEKLEQNARNGSTYFFWIAFFSVFNKVMDILSTKRRFVFGLGAPQYVERVLAQTNPALIWGITITLAIVFVLFGIFARRKNIPVYILGIIVYLVDMALSILAGDIVGTLVHIVFTVLLVMGLIAARKLKSLSPS